MYFFNSVFTVEQGFSNLPNSLAFSIIDACMLLFYIQLGGCKSVVGLWEVIHREHACTHTPTCYLFHPHNPAPSSPSCPIKVENLGKWNETSKSRLLLWLTWYDLYYNLDPVLLHSLLLPPTRVLPTPFSSLSLLRLAQEKKGKGSLYNTCNYMYANTQLQSFLKIYNVSVLAAYIVEKYWTQQHKIQTGC